MKNLMNLFAAVILAAFVSSCSTQDKTPPGPGPGEQSLTFVFKGLGNGAVTYAIATPSENTVDELDVYMFEHAADGSGQFHKKWNLSDPECQLKKEDLTTYTVKVSGADSYGSTKKVFYFVANGTPTTSLDATGKTEADFRELLTKQLAVTDTKGDLLETPLLFTGKTDAVDPFAPTGITVTMKRRVARFDIVNNYAHFVVEKVFVSDAKLQGYAFGNATGSGSPVFPTASLKEIATIPAFVTEDGERIAHSVFYLYPTQIGQTQIAIQASINGEPSDIYYVDPSVNTTIEANHRYKLVIHEDLTYGMYFFSLELADWNSGDDVSVDEKNTLKLVDYAVDPATEIGKWDEPTKVYTLNESTATKMTFTAKDVLNLTHEITVTDGDAADVIALPVFSSTRTLTYGTVVSHACEVTMPNVKNDIDEEVTIRLRVKNAAHTDEYADIYFQKEVPPVPPGPDPESDWTSNYPWVGAFYRASETGERIINSAYGKKWTAEVTAGDFIVLDRTPSADPNYYTDTPGNAEDYPVTGTATSVTGTGNIYFRIGLTSQLSTDNPDYTTTPRYGVVTLTLDPDGTPAVHKIFVRQGEAPDNLAPSSTVKLMPYNLTNPAASDADADINTGVDLGFEGGGFTKFPTQVGYFFNWNATHAYYPTGDFSAWIVNSSHSLFSPKPEKKICPDGYHAPNIEYIDYRTFTGEYYDGLYPSTLVMGYYADGWFDRQKPENSLSTNKVKKTRVNTGHQVAYYGTLFYNEEGGRNASLFMPATGNRGGQNVTDSGGAVGGSYWGGNNLTNSSGAGLSLSISRSITPSSTTRSKGYVVRCAKD